VTLDGLGLVLLATVPVGWMIVGRLWHVGRLSDRTAAIAVVASLPVFVFVVLIVAGVSPVVSAAFTLIPAAVARLMYQTVRHKRLTVGVGSSPHGGGHSRVGFSGDGAGLPAK
jgi:uncharacterized membrane protein YgcG